MQSVWEIIKRLTGNSHDWALANIPRIWSWIRAGRSDTWIIREIRKIIGS